LKIFKGKVFIVVRLEISMTNMDAQQIKGCVDKEIVRLRHLKRCREDGDVESANPDRDEQAIIDREESHLKYMEELAGRLDGSMTRLKDQRIIDGDAGDELRIYPSYTRTQGQEREEALPAEPMDGENPDKAFYRKAECLLCKLKRMVKRFFRKRRVRAACSG
jgi:hypothetical protein